MPTRPQPQCQHPAQPKHRRRKTMAATTGRPAARDPRALYQQPGRGAASAPSSQQQAAPLPRITTTDIIARARKQVRTHDGGAQKKQRPGVGSLRPIADEDVLRQLIGAVWKELDALSPAAPIAPGAAPATALKQTVRRVRSISQAVAKAQADVQHKIQGQQEAMHRGQQAMRAVVAENEQLQQELHATREALQLALQSRHSLTEGIKEESSEVTSSDGSSSDGEPEQAQAEAAEMPKQPEEEEEGAQLPPFARHSIAAGSGAALITEAARAAKDGERMQLQKTEQTLVQEQAARRRAEEACIEAKEETEAVEHLRVVETKQWVDELERIEVAAQTEINKLASQRQEARETAIELEEDLRHERKHIVALETVADAVALGAATEVERLRLAQIERMQAQASEQQRVASTEPAQSAKSMTPPVPSAQQGQSGSGIPHSLADLQWVRDDSDGAEGLCSLGATSPTGSMLPSGALTPAPGAASSPLKAADNRPTPIILPAPIPGSAAKAGPVKAKAKAGGLKVTIPGQTISEAAAVLGDCHGRGAQDAEEGFETVVGLISGIAANVADKAVAKVAKETAVSTRGAGQDGGVRVSVTPMGQIRATCTPNSRYAGTPHEPAEG